MPAQSSCQTLGFQLNGLDISIEGGGDLSLLEVLRERCGITSPKDGCRPLGQCGCCTVLVDGMPRLSCTMKAAKVAGRRVTTLEGLPEEARQQLAECFVRAGGVQCGFCIPGIAMRSHALLERHPEPSREAIAAELRAHLCRCTGYTKIIDAVELLARVRRGEPLPADDGPGGVGARLPKYGGRAAVLGEQAYIDDITIPAMACGALRFSDHPRALIKRIDTTAAEALEGVIRVFTWRDVPGDRFVGLIERDWPIFVAQAEETRCVGDVLAAVVASDRSIAREAAALIEVDYEVRRPVTDPIAALEPDAPKIHPQGNLLSRSTLVRGDVAAALAASEHVVEGDWETQRIEHLYLEPEACIAIPLMYSANCADSNSARSRPMWREGAKFESVSDVPAEQRGLHLLTQGQGVFDDRRQICDVLGWPVDRLTVELLATGGAFGGKEDMSIQAQTALLAHLTGRPVKMVLSRKESLRLHPKRHPIRLHYQVGCDARGRLTALQARIVGDTGAYASVGAKVLERTAGHAAGAYRVENIDIQSLAVYTNNPPCGAMRGFGVNQAAFAIEGCLDMLAEKVGIDGWEMRSRNIIEPGDRFSSGQRLSKPFGLRQTLEAVKDVYRSARHAGIACGVKNVGIGNGIAEAGRATLTVEKSKRQNVEKSRSPNVQKSKRQDVGTAECRESRERGRVVIRSGFTEMGQGLFTVLIQAAVEETGLPAEMFDVTTDTRDRLDCGQTTASRGTVLGCHGVIDAARKLRADLDAGKSLDELVGKVYEGEWVCFPTDEFGAEVADPQTHLTYGYATQVVILDDDGRIVKVVAAHDVGRAINPVLLEGQIEGGIHMGLGYALTEELVVEGGRIKKEDVKSCGVLRAHQMPEVEVILIEEGDPDCPYGARGVGEIGLVPTAPAVAGALYSLDGIRRTKLPMKDSPAARYLARPRRSPKV